MASIDQETLAGTEHVLHSSNGDSSASKEQEEVPEGNLERATELFEKGSKAIEDGDYVGAVDSLSRALEIRAAHYGELAAECAISYYKYGRALLYKSQVESDPLGTVLKSTPKNAGNDYALSHVESSGSSKASTSGLAIEDNLSRDNEEVEGANDKDQEAVNEVSDGNVEELPEAGDEDSDLDQAWKMLDVATAVVKNSPEDTILKANILSALGEVSMEREDFDTSLNDYLKALSTLETLVEPESTHCIVELNFRACLVLEVGGKIEEAIPYCQKAISLCASWLKRQSETVNLTGSPVQDATTVANSDGGGLQASGKTAGDLCNLEEDEKLVLTGTLSKLERKLEDLQQVISNSKPIFSEMMKMLASNSTSGEINLSDMESRSLSLTSSQLGAVSHGFDSPTISTAGTNGGITNLGVVGRGVKRVALNPIGIQPLPKKLSLETSAETIGSRVDSASRYA